MSKTNPYVSVLRRLADEIGGASGFEFYGYEVIPCMSLRVNGNVDVTSFSAQDYDGFLLRSDGTVVTEMDSNSCKIDDQTTVVYKGCEGHFELVAVIDKLPTVESDA